MRTLECALGPDKCIGCEGTVCELDFYRDGEAAVAPRFPVNPGRAPINSLADEPDAHSTFTRYINPDAFCVCGHAWLNHDENGCKCCACPRMKTED